MCLLETMMPCLYNRMNKTNYHVKRKRLETILNKNHTKCCGLQAGYETKIHKENPSRCYTCIITESLSFEP